MTAETEPQTAVQCWSLLRPAVQSEIATPPQRLTKHCYASGQCDAERLTASVLGAGLGE